MSAKAAVDTGDVELVEKDGGDDVGQWSKREMSKRQMSDKFGGPSTALPIITHTARHMPAF